MEKFTLKSSFITVENPLFYKLFEFKNENGEVYKLTVPEYQRPYVWKAEKVIQLMNDIKEYLESQQYEDGVDYYMGTVILHKDAENNVLNIVDGQQRITTLLILEYSLLHKTSLLCKHPDRVEIDVPTNEARARMSAVLKRCNESLQLCQYNCLKSAEFFKHLKFTVIITEKEDDAFTFFDSQNNRGIQPSAIDVLKAVHLRGITKDPQLQIDCAEKWESVQNFSTNIFRNSIEEYLDDLVTNALWKLRKWTGTHFIEQSNYELSMQEFGEKPTKSSINDITFYSSFSINNMLLEGTLSATDNQYSSSDKPDKLFPFAIRQPLKKGVSFFGFVQTYHLIANKLFVDIPKDEDISNVQRLFAKLYTEVAMSRFMTDYFIMMMIFYYDKFGSRRLFEYALWIDYVIGRQRINYVFFKQKRMRIFTQEYNIIDKIQLAYQPEDVIDYVSSIVIENRNIGDKINNPIKRYIEANKNYFQFEKDEDIYNNKVEYIKRKIYGKQ